MRGGLSCGKGLVAEADLTHELVRLLALFFAFVLRNQSLQEALRSPRVPGAKFAALVLNVCSVVHAKFLLAGEAQRRRSNADPSSVQF